MVAVERYTALATCQQWALHARTDELAGVGDSHFLPESLAGHSA